MGIVGGFISNTFFSSKEFDRVIIFNTLNVFWMYFSNQIDSYTLQKTPLNYFDWGNPQSISSYQIDFDNQQNTTIPYSHQLGLGNLL